MLLATLALCVLALYMLNSAIGSRLSLPQTTAVVLSAILVTSMVMAALTPPVGFLMLTSLRNPGLTVLLNLVVICLAGPVGHPSRSRRQRRCRLTRRCGPLPRLIAGVDGALRAGGPADAVALFAPTSQRASSSSAPSASAQAPSRPSRSCYRGGAEAVVRARGVERDVRAGDAEVKQVLVADHQVAPGADLLPPREPAPAEAGRRVVVGRSATMHGCAGSTSHLAHHCVCTSFPGV